MTSEIGVKILENENIQDKEEIFQTGRSSTAIGKADTVHIHNVTQPEAKEPLTRNRIRLYEELGITDCTKELKGTQLEPMQCMKQVRASLSFMGVGGEKWVKDQQLQKAFKIMLRLRKSMGG